MRPSLLSSGLESSLLLVKLTFLVVSTIQWVTLPTHAQVKATHIAKKDSSSSVCWWVTLTCLSLWLFFYLYWNLLLHISFCPFSCQWLPPVKVLITARWLLTSSSTLALALGGLLGLALIVASLTSQTNCNQYYSQLHYRVDPTKMGHRGKMGHYS